MNNRLIKSNDAGGGGACTNTVDLYNPFPDGGGVALYQLNGDATDESGNYDGTATNVTYGTGVFGQAGVFNGSSYIQAAAGYPSTLGNITVSGWFNFSNSNDGWTGNNSGSLFGLGQSTSVVAGNSLTIRAGANNNIISFNSTNYDLYDLTIPDSFPPIGTWFHLAITYNNDKFKVYLNGVFQIETVSRSYNFETTAFRVGSGIQNGGVFYFQGLSDQVRIFNRALRPYEVEALYTEEYCTPTIVPSEHFNTVTWTSTGGNTNISVTGVGFQPDLVWAKARTDAYDHTLYDSVRGAGSSHWLSSSLTNSESSLAASAAQYGYINSFDADGFTANAGTSDNSFFNFNTGKEYVAWNFKAGGAAVTNTDGTITSQVSANTEAGFSVVKYFSNFSSSNSASVGHGLTQAPQIIISKGLDTTSNWRIRTNTITGSPYDFLEFDTGSIGQLSSSDGTLNMPTDTKFDVNWNSSIGASGNTIAYCFAEVEGFSNFGSYVGNGSTSGPTVITGFESAFIMVKCSSSTGDWVMLDNKRTIENPRNKALWANLSNAEATGYSTDFLENGFQIKDNGSALNASGSTYIYMAFAADPTAVEPTLEDSFNTVTYTAQARPYPVTVGFTPDLIWVKSRTSSYNHGLFDTLRDNGRYLKSNTADAESSTSDTAKHTLTDTGFIWTETAGSFNSIGDYVAWCWKGAEIPAINSNGSIPSVVSANPAAGFSIVTFTGNGLSNQTIGHGLEATPSVVINKGRANLAQFNQWLVYHKDLPTNQMLYLNTTDFIQDGQGNYYADSLFSSSVFGVGNDIYGPNVNGTTYVSYVFAEVAGFSKFGSYTGIASGNVTVDCGFEPAFVMVKCSSHSSTNWEMLDNKRNLGVDGKYRLRANDSSADAGFNNSPIKFTSTGFYLDSSVTGNSYVDYDANGRTYIYMAFANQF